MGPKKNQKSGKNPDEEDTSTEDLLFKYKKNCKLAGIPYSKNIENLINEKIDEGSDLNELVIHESIGEDGAIELCKALKEVNNKQGYKHLQSIRIWEGNLGNQGVAAFCRYISETCADKVNLLEFMNCNIGVLGCEIISRLLSPSTKINIKILTLDYNLIGNLGLKELANNLCLSNKLTYLSLNYCGIDSEGVDLLIKIFENETTSIEKLFIQGNCIGNSGITKLFNFLSLNNSLPLEELNISNTSIGNNSDLLKSILNIMSNNLNINSYNFKYNLITEIEFSQIVDLLTTQKSNKITHIYQFFVDELYSSVLFEKYFAAMKGRKKPKPKKKAK